MVQKKEPWLGNDGENLTQMIDRISKDLKRSAVLSADFITNLRVYFDVIRAKAYAEGWNAALDAEMAEKEEDVG